MGHLTLEEQDVFTCTNCRRSVSSNKDFGSAHRNHCSFCGYSLHVDKTKGDRASECGGKMEPIGLMYKSHDELCIVHRCVKCGKINYNRIAADDDATMIEGLIDKPDSLGSDVIKQVESEGLKLLGNDEKNDIKTQLYGKNFT